MLPPPFALKADIQQISPAISDPTSPLPGSDALPKAPMIPSACPQVTLSIYIVCLCLSLAVNVSSLRAGAVFSTVPELPVIEQNFTEGENVKQTAAQKHGPPRPSTRKYQSRDHPQTCTWCLILWASLAY